MANLSNINNKFLVTTGGNVLIGQTAAVGSSILQVTGDSTFTPISTVSFIVTNSGNALRLISGVPSGVTWIGKPVEYYASEYAFSTDVTGAGSYSQQFVIENNGDVGIGVSSPIKKLQVSSFETGDLINILCVNRRDQNGDTASIGFSMTDNNLYNKAAVIFERTTTQGRGSLHFATNNTNSSANVGKGDARMTILAAGNVGIGTISPTEKLSVSGNIELDDMPAAGTRYLMTNETSTGTGRLNIQAGGGSAAYGGGLSLIANSHASKPGWVIAGISSGAGAGATEGRFVVNTHGLGTGTDIFTVLRTGNVGIGTTGPGAKLEVNANSGILTQEILKVKGGGSGGAYGFLVEANNGDNLFKVDTNTYNVGIGIASPAAKLDVLQETRISYLQGSQYRTRITNTDGNTRILSDGQQCNIIFGTTGNVANGTASEKMRIDWQGNVGINNTSPAKKLEISSPTSSDGILLTGDGTGSGFATGNYREIGFSYTDTDTSYGSSIKFEVPDSQNHGGQISFWTDSMTTAPAGLPVRAMTISRSQNVGIGTASPSSKLQVVAGNSQEQAWFGETGYTSAAVRIGGDNGGGGRLYIQYIGDSSYIDCYGGHGSTERYRDLGLYARNLKFFTTSGASPSEVMRITSGGTTEFKKNVDILTDQNTNILKVRSTSGSFTSSILLVDCDRGTTNNTYNLANFAQLGNAKCVITDGGDLKNTNNSYGALSDERLKENIIDATPKLDDLMKVKIKTFNLKGDELKQIGVVAQELEEVFPGMVSSAKTPDSEDETLYKSVKYSVFVPMLIKAIQELKADNDILKSKIETLENK